MTERRGGPRRRWWLDGELQALRCRTETCARASIPHRPSFISPTCGGYRGRGCRDLQGVGGARDWAGRVWAAPVVGKSWSSPQRSSKEPPLVEVATHDLSTIPDGSAAEDGGR